MHNDIIINENISNVSVIIDNSVNLSYFDNAVKQIRAEFQNKFDNLTEFERLSSDIVETIDEVNSMQTTITGLNLEHTIVNTANISLSSVDPSINLLHQTVENIISHGIVDAGFF
jgi:hypothetical protein